MILLHEKAKVADCRDEMLAEDTQRCGEIGTSECCSCGTSEQRGHWRRVRMRILGVEPNDAMLAERRREALELGVIVVAAAGRIVPTPLEPAVGVETANAAGAAGLSPCDIATWVNEGGERTEPNSGDSRL